jgi:hypothetical protein
VGMRPLAKLMRVVLTALDVVVVEVSVQLVGILLRTTYMTHEHQHLACCYLH